MGGALESCGGLSVSGDARVVVCLLAEELSAAESVDVADGLPPPVPPGGPGGSSRIPACRNDPSPSPARSRCCWQAGSCARKKTAVARIRWQKIEPSQLGIITQLNVFPEERSVAGAAPFISARFLPGPVPVQGKFLSPSWSSNDP